MNPLKIPASGYNVKSTQSPYILVSPRFETIEKSEFGNTRRLNGGGATEPDHQYPHSARNEQPQEFSPIKALNEMKRKRKVMELTKDLLKNRLVALSQEQKRMDQQVLGIKKRSEDLLAKRVEHEKRMKEKKAHEEAKAKKEKNKKDFQELIQTARTKKLAEIEKIKRNLSEEKRKEHAKIQVEKKKNLDRVHHSKQESLDHAKLAYLKKKEEERIQAEKKKAQLEFKAALIREERQREIEQEEAAVKKKEKEIQDLVDKEARMLDALHTTGNAEFLAQRALTEIAEMPLKEAVQKYSVYLPKKSPTKIILKSPRTTKLKKLNHDLSPPVTETETPVIEDPIVVENPVVVENDVVDETHVAEDPVVKDPVIVENHIFGENAVITDDSPNEINEEEK